MKVAKEAIKEAKRKQYDVVIVDTAGGVSASTAELMKQAANIRKAVDPDEVLFVIDAMIGQDARAPPPAPFQEGVRLHGRRAVEARR